MSNAGYGGAMEAEPFESVDSQLRQVRRKLEQMAHYRAMSGLSEAEQSQYQCLCEEEGRLLSRLVG
jgi:hypothetical protein